LTPLHASARLPSRVGIMLRTMPPPEGIAHVWNRCVCGSKRTSVFGRTPDSLYHTNRQAVLPAGAKRAAHRFRGSRATVNDSEPDYRYTLANERTFLAYVRTALALDGAGLAVVQFLTKIGSVRGREIVAMLLVLCGLGTVLAGFLRWRSVQAAMRVGAPLPSSWIPLALTAIIAAGSLVAAIALALR
jgi:putative membrane protein